MAKRLGPLGKTEIKLLKRTTQYKSGRIYTTLAHGRGCSGLEGGRESDAACKLRDRGYLVHISQEQDRDTKAGYTTFITSSVWEVTEAGRAALAELTEGVTV